MQHIVQSVLNEIEKQDVKWGSNRILEKRLWLTIMAEEFGEIARAILEKDNDNYREELVQLAALCIQAVSSLEKEESSS